MNEFFTWESLATLTGCAVATATVTQFVKDLGALSKIPTQIVSYVIALVVLVAATAAIGTASGWSDWAILPLQAIVVTLTANGTFSAVQRAKTALTGTAKKNE